MGKLTSVLVERAKPQAKYIRLNDGDGLSLVIRPSGSKAWQVRTVKDGRKTNVGIGAYPKVKLAEARRKAQEIRAAGPSEPEASISHTPTFAQVAELYLKANAPTWRHPKTEADMRTRFEIYAYPAFGNTAVDRIRRSDVTAVLEVLWTAKPAASRKLKQALGRVFVYALARDWITTTPVDDAVSQGLPRNKSTQAHFRSLAYQDVPDALGTVDKSTAGPAVRLCLRWLVLTASRSGEARNARWQDMDIQGQTWTIPGDMMKTGAEHRVPLSSQAVAVLKEAMKLMDGSGFVFPGLRGALSDMTLTKLLRDNGLADRATVHGFRTSFKTWCMETTDTPWAVGEAALAHTLGNSTEQAYARTDLFDRRRVLMQAWADFTQDAHSQEGS